MEHVAPHGLAGSHCPSKLDYARQLQIPACHSLGCWEDGSMGKTTILNPTQHQHCSTSQRSNHSHERSFLPPQTSLYNFRHRNKSAMCGIFFGQIASAYFCSGHRHRPEPLCGRNGQGHSQHLRKVFPQQHPTCCPKRPFRHRSPFQTAIQHSPRASFQSCRGYDVCASVAFSRTPAWFGFSHLSLYRHPILQRRRPSLPHRDRPGGTILQLQRHGLHGHVRKLGTYLPTTRTNWPDAFFQNHHPTKHPSFVFDETKRLASLDRKPRRNRADAQLRGNQNPLQATAKSPVRPESAVANGYEVFPHRHPWPFSERSPQNNPHKKGKN